MMRKILVGVAVEVLLRLALIVWIYMQAMSQ
jgi:hypothetical protein